MLPPPQEVHQGYIKCWVVVPFYAQVIVALLTVHQKITTNVHRGHILVTMQATTSCRQDRHLWLRSACLALLWPPALSLEADLSKQQVNLLRFRTACMLVSRGIWKLPGSCHACA